MEYSDDEDMTYIPGQTATQAKGRKPSATARGGNTSSASSRTSTSGATEQNMTGKGNKRTESERLKNNADESVDSDKRNVEQKCNLHKDKDTCEANGKKFYRAKLLDALPLIIAVIAIAVAFYPHFISVVYSKQGKPLKIDPEHFAEVQEFIEELSKRLSSVESSLDDFKQIKARIEGFEEKFKNSKTIVYKDDFVMKKELEDRVRESKHDLLDFKDDFLKFKDEVGVGISDIKKEQKGLQGDVMTLQGDVMTLQEKLGEQSQFVEEKNAEMLKQISLNNETIHGLNVSVENLDITLSGLNVSVENLCFNISSLNVSVYSLAENMTGISIETLVLDKRTGDIKENIFDKWSLTVVIMTNTSLLVLVIIYLVAIRDNNRHVNQNMDIEEQQVNHNPAPYSTARRILSQVRAHPHLERKLCIISFYEETHPLHMHMTQSVTRQLNLEIVDFIIRRHEDILKIPPVSLYFLFVDFNERNVILEDPTLGLGDLRLTTVQAVQKMGGRIVIFYVRDQNSRQLDSTKLYNEDLASVTRQRELSALNQLSRFISAYDQLTDFQKAHLRKILVDELYGR